MTRSKAKPAPAALSPGRLVFEEGARSGTVFPIILQETLVGRIDSAQLVLDEASVSRLHARLVLEKGEVWVEDLDSREGTWVNGVAVRRVKLFDGDHICFGDAALRFER